MVGECFYDPYKFVMMMWPWGEPGPLEAYEGPDTWQEDALQDLGEKIRRNGFDVDNPVPVDPIRQAFASGHGIGKGVYAAFVANFIMSTRPRSVGTVTANTYVQLQTRTWATITTWMKRAINAHWWSYGSQRIYSLAENGQNDWYLSAQTCREENADSFQGQHAARASSFYLFDEASNIAKPIWEAAEGGLSDGEPFFVALGNPTRSNGQFHYCVFGSGRELWSGKSIDSEKCRMPNKKQIEAWRKEHGEDSDFFRVRVKGLPPNASDLQFISTQLIRDAQRRQVITLPDDPLICGLDLARGGEDKCVFFFRKGLDARTIKPIMIPGEKVRDSELLIAKASEVLNARYPGGDKIAAMFVDGTGGLGAIVDRLKALGHKNVHEINFANSAPDSQYYNMRAYIWGMGKEWLQRGAIPDDPQIEQDLSGTGFKFKGDAILLESKESMKERGLASPDIGDSLMLTFSRSVAPLSKSLLRARERADSIGSRLQSEHGWMA